MTTAPGPDPFAAAPPPRGRFLHALNPLAKIAGPLPAIVAVLFAHTWALPALLATGSLILVLVGARLSGRALLGLLVVLPLATAVLTLSFAFWSDGGRASATPLLVELGPVRLHEGALLAGGATALRLAAILLLSLVGGLSTTGPDLARSLVQQLRVPYRVGYTALAAYRFVPRFGHELDVIRQAHRVRGMAPGRGPLPALRRRAGYLVPLLAGALRHAERVALAMDSRAFGAHPTRTERHLVPWRRRDTVFVLLAWLATALAIALAIAPADLIAQKV
ncbi:energy-coupling factor transporter transmembrane protein EcfT [Herbiconiux sp. CPCC 205716]|uniref:Energy-coupling factor transporter transmembrane protein EcfT n=1 Tax=Herbiconiux gentiana TaxID=2970912 RepID=A0ABT2GCH9_9MICO|nr:energy-coupling factor transporter transmembrane component T [Herbiconiux gentiana]MCS5713913.1 energy-coupling factor transporter transmembrane protein EcfT [Herbiconiux gentiana]